jgi:hypothetical protein
MSKPQTPNMEEYATYNELFSTKSDNRVSLWLHELKEQVDERMSKSGKSIAALQNYDPADMYFDGVTPSMKNDVFVNKDMQLSGNDIHPEWTSFFVELYANLSNKISEKREKQKLIGTIKSWFIGAHNESKSLRQFVWALVINMFQLAANRTQINFPDSNTLLNGLDNIIIPTPDNLFRNYSLVPGPALMDSDTFLAGVQQVAANILSKTVKAITNTMFNIDLNKLLIKQMIKQAGEQPQSLGVSTDFFKVDMDEGKYARDANGLLVELGDQNFPNGKPVDSKSLQLKLSDQCFGTGVSNSNPGKCAEYLRDCLKGRPNGIQNCKKFMKDHDFWKNAENDAKNISPLMMVTTLNDFNFDIEDYVHPVTKQNLNRFKDVNEWLNKLNKLAEANKGLGKKEFDQIKRNDKMQGYLAMLVKRVNDNPIILNPDFNGQPKAPGASVTRPIGNHLTKIGLAPYSPGLGMSGLTRAHHSTVAQLPPRINFGLAVLPLGNGMIGGATYRDIIQDHVDIRDNKNLQLWSVFEGEYNTLVAKLDQYGKKISSDDDQEIKKIIKQLKQSELSLSKSILYAAKYAKLLEVYGQHDVNKVLKMTDLQKFVDARDHYFKKVAERRNTLYNIIQAVAEATVKEAQSKNVQPVADAKNGDVSSLQLKL